MLRLIPGLEQAEFVRFGMVHRNTYINGPTVLLPTWQARTRAELFFAGQMSRRRGLRRVGGVGAASPGCNAAALALGRARQPRRRARRRSARWRTTCRTPMRRTTSRPTSPSASCRRSRRRPAAARRRAERKLAVAARRSTISTRGCGDRHACDAGRGSADAPGADRAAPAAHARGRARWWTRSRPTRSAPDPRFHRVPRAQPQRVGAHGARVRERPVAVPRDHRGRRTAAPAPADHCRRDFDADAMRGFLGELHRAGTSRASAARKLAAVRTFLRYLRREG